MPANQESLRDLVESRAAATAVAPRKLWGAVLDAIITGDALLPVLPDDISLDSPFDHGGMPQTWRAVLKSALRALDRFNPSEYNWATQLMFDPASFDRWLYSWWQTLDRTEPSQLPMRKRALSLEVRRVVRQYAEEERNKNRSTSIPRMWEYVKKHLTNATRNQALKELHAIERGPKKRGRPRSMSRKIELK
jgi:hypothetical protein